MASAEYLLSRRNDLSSYLVHLTRSYGKRTSEDNLRRILNRERLLARNPHCLFSSRIDRLTSDQSDLFNTVCFSEIPLSDLNYLTHKMEGRSCNLSQYGLVFDKAVVRDSGGNPVFYVDTRSSEGKARCDALWRCFRTATKKDDANHCYYSFLPFVNKAGLNYDFSWEREWRIVGDFDFERSDVFLGLAPENKLAGLEASYPEIPWVSPRWGRDRMLSKLRQLATKRKR
jgi:hypothetical protein